MKPIPEKGKTTSAMTLKNGQAHFITQDTTRRKKKVEDEQK
jgi:hypothetical protein